VFVSDRDEGRDLYLVAPDGSDTTVLTDPGFAFHDEAPCWSPDGNHVVFQRQTGTADQIFTIDRNGAGLTQLTFDSPGNGSPCYSPDGNRIVFTASGGSASGRLIVMDADGSNRTTIVDDFGVIADPDWQSVELPPVGPVSTTTTMPTTSTTTPAPPAPSVVASPRFTG
jgi:TolB protein